MKGWESDDEVMDGCLVFMNVTAWRYVGDDEIRYGRWFPLCNQSYSIFILALLLLYELYTPRSLRKCNSGNGNLTLGTQQVV
jgi:hypothetical protein